MSNKFFKKFSETILLIDGAMGTQLYEKGMTVGEASEKWNLEHPEIVLQIHQDYVAVGADIILTNTFGGNRYKLASHHLEDKVIDINRSAAEIARKAAGSKVFVAASIGPTGQFLEPLGTVTEVEMIQVFEEQIKVLVASGIDIVCIETMSDAAEAGCAVKAARNVSQLPVIASMTYQKGKMGYRTMMGQDIPTCVASLTEAGADVLATNCGYGIDQMIEIVKEMHEHTGLPIMAEPNAGLPELVQGRTIYNETPMMMASKLGLLILAGARIVGGCCGTTPAYIKKFRTVIDNLVL
ncbi:homocysteine S-methyltransferase family protein [candidate division KSB1 bacterium]|nr:homocysteine S-methyltransferase family protein [candidate division KSB1 bacterium]